MSATSWNSELPSGRNPFWIKDEAMSGLGLHVGDAVSVDTRREPAEGDLVLVEAETDELSDRLVRRYFADEAGDQVRLVPANPDYPELHLSSDQMLVLGVVCARVRFEPASNDALKIVEEPIEGRSPDSR
jgi:SOS-response transcriptional repressor LexA